MFTITPGCISALFCRNEAQDGPADDAEKF